MARTQFKKLYDSRKWRRQSAAHRAAHPLCKRCEDAGRVTIATIAHHVVPYQGKDEAAFYLGELESICHDCHEREHNRNPSSGFSREVGVDGWPIDPSHPAYQREGKRR